MKVATQKEIRAILENARSMNGDGITEADFAKVIKEFESAKLAWRVWQTVLSGAVTVRWNGKECNFVSASFAGAIEVIEEHTKRSG